jgi:hypothetical protein
MTRIFLIFNIMLELRARRNYDLASCGNVAIGPLEVCGAVIRQLAVDVVHVWLVGWHGSME